MTDDPYDAYHDALKMLARRELSEAQVRERLARKGYKPDVIDSAVARLVAERAIDDVRAAETIARTESALRRRGKLRVRHRIEQAGISGRTARRAVDEVFDAIDANDLIEASLARRLGRRDRIGDDAEFRRLYRYLVGQGFEPERVMAVLRNRKEHKE